MKTLRYIFCAVFLQIATAQVLSNIPRYATPGQIITNQPMPIQQMTNANINPIAIPDGIPRTGYPNVVNGMPYIPNNLANAPIANAINEQAIVANPNIGGILTSEIANANIGGINPNIATLANMANINGNMATFNLGNGGFTVTSGSPGIPGFGIQVLADALEVGGKVAVNGQIPIFGSVSLNGNLPTEGSASVSYACGGQKTSDGVVN
ncbi:uncharacterized PPE family protein PPE24-like [Maniola jurtina]|uniref:uncharacterized PPE family protein PPE24-like n=1 Tax=Maniola jurtina TaxID=191418 RepID=UPI001E68AFCB|nr:uncharacterized PPE family protein PPE24-like [Maniola jurtina]